MTHRCLLDCDAV